MPVELFHHRTIAETVDYLLVDGESLGLTQIEAQKRQLQFGNNSLPKKLGRSLIRMIWDQFANMMIVVLLVAAFISGLLHDITDSLVILAIVLLNALVGFVQDYQAQKSLAALQQFLPRFAKVYRDHKWITLPVEQLVPGDWIELEAGDLVPADLRLTETHQAFVDESALTGESVPVVKQAVAQLEYQTAMGDRTNLAYSGTLFVRGRARGLATHIGAQTELGKIAQLLGETVEPPTPLQIRLDKFGRMLTWSLLLLCLCLYLIGLLRGNDHLSMLLLSISLAVAAIPEALPSVITAALSLGAKKMAHKKALVQKLAAVEALGSVTTICSDKTGTLTQNKMVLSEFFLASPDLKKLFFRNLSLNNDVSFSATGTGAGASESQGEATEKAICEFAQKEGFDKSALLELSPRLNEIPFDPAYQYMVVQHQFGEKNYWLIKGSPESIFRLCASDSRLVSFVEQAQQMAERGLRTLAFAQFCPEGRQVLDMAQVNSASWKLQGLVGLQDPPRPEVKEAIRLCYRAGIKVKMITGDHPKTANSIALALGIQGEVLTGPELHLMSDAELNDRIDQIGVFARTRPDQKIRIVRALQSRGEMIAMTGDGVNDAPALKQAHVGIAMGLTGTDVARQAAAMVLLDDNFSTIVDAVKEGRRIFGNIKKFLVFVLTGNLGEILTISVAIFAGFSAPLLPVQILWINLVTDGFPGIALSTLPAADQVMAQKPIPKNHPFLDSQARRSIIYGGLLVAAASLAAYFFGSGVSQSVAQTMCFSTLAVSQLFVALGVSSQPLKSLIDPRQAPWLKITLALCMGLQILAVHSSFLQNLLHTTPLDLNQWGVCVLLSVLVFLVKKIPSF